MLETILFFIGLLIGVIIGAFLLMRKLFGGDKFYW